MASIKLKAYAKINLSLDVLGKRPDGYHEIRTIMQSIGLHDRVFIEIADNGIEVISNNKWVPSGEKNIAFKAADLVIKRFNLNKGVRIKIDKRIPVAAGLAGGSTDAASVLKGMNSIFSLGMNEQDLLELGKQIGADVPFCIKGGTMLSEGIGEILTQLPPMGSVPLVLIKPRIGVSTAWVYSNLSLENITCRPDTDSLIRAIHEHDKDYLAKNMKNVLESVTEKKFEIITDIKKQLIDAGALGSMMSGSGPSVFGLFKDKKTALHAFKKLKSRKWECFLTQTYNEER